MRASIAITLLAIAVGIFFAGCSKEELSCPECPDCNCPDCPDCNCPDNTEPFVLMDPRDGQEYKTVQLLGKTWMAENLNFIAEGSYCYDMNLYWGATLGRLYPWEATADVCPPGWRLPTKEEFEQLANSYGSGPAAYSALIANGSSGFNALLGGWWREDYEEFLGLGISGFYWSSSESGTNGYLLHFTGNADPPHAGISSFPKTRLASCRCLKTAD